MRLAVVFSRPSMMAQREMLMLTRAKKKAAGGKRRGKVKVEAPEGFDIDMMAKDWAAWEHGSKIDVSLPFKEGEEPEWALAAITSPHISRIEGDLSNLDLEKHGMRNDEARYTLRKLREAKIKQDNDMRAEGKWDLVGSLQGTRLKKRKSLSTRGNLT